MSLSQHMIYFNNLRSTRWLAPATFRRVHALCFPSSVSIEALRYRSPAASMTSVIPRAQETHTENQQGSRYAVLGGLTAAFLLNMYLSPTRASAAEGNQTPGEHRTIKSTIGEYGAELLQSHAPLRGLHTHVTSILLFANDPNKQIIVHGYISHINEDLMYELLYDSDKSDAKLIGVKFIVSEKLFRSIPEDEKKFWSSNAYAARSGILVAPGMPWVMEHKLMEELSPTYSKAIAIWAPATDNLPFGAPHLLMNPTHDGQVNPRLIQERDARLGINTAKERENRHNIVIPRLEPGTDAWEIGQAYDFVAAPLNKQRAKDAVARDVTP